MVKQPAGGMRRKRMSIEDTPIFVRSRLKSLIVYRRYIACRRDEFKGLRLFAPLVERCNDLDGHLQEWESCLWRCALEEIADSELQAFLDDEMREIWDLFAEGPSYPHDELDAYGTSEIADDAYDDALQLMGTVWSEMCKHYEELHDALLSTNDRAVAVPSWLQ